MNLAQVVSFVLYTSLFTGLSIITTIIIDEHNCVKLTEEKYLQSSVYKNTKTPYDKALKACFEFQNVLSIISVTSPIIGFGLGSFSLYHYRTKKPKEDTK